MIKGIVSIISPCYNGEQYVSRFLESILLQTYKDIELIIIIDGSTDKTEEIILSYKSKFENVGIKFKYIYQENKGQAEAINQGLKIFEGEFLTWPDSDDTLHPDSIKKKVEFLNNNLKYGFVRTTANIIDSETGKIIGALEPKKKLIKDNLFEDFIFEKDVWFAPGCYMVRTEAFLKSNPSRTIYNSRGGQNWQMLLPISYKYKCGYINEKLYNYYLRKNSHSHIGVNSIELQLNKINEYKKIILVVLSEIGVLDKYKKRLDIKYLKKILKLAFRFGDKNLLKKEYIQLKNMKAVDIKTRIIYLFRNE